MDLGDARRIDVSAELGLNTKHIITTLPERPGYAKLGKEVAVRLNQFKVEEWPQRKIYQYDVLIGSGTEKRGLIRAIWQSNKLQDKLKELDLLWLFDWNRIAWCTSEEHTELRIMVDMDVEKGRKPRTDKPNVHRVVIKFAKELDLNSIRGYIDKVTPFDNSVLEGINFLDHLMRQHPSEKFTTLRRSFYNKIDKNSNTKQFALNSVTEAVKGVYSSMRLVPKVGSQGTCTGLAVNVDVANGVFWVHHDLLRIVKDMILGRRDPNSMARFLQPVKDDKGLWAKSKDFMELQKLSGLRFETYHTTPGFPKNKSKVTEYVIDKFEFGQKYGQEGGHSKAVKFLWKNPSTDPPVEEAISVYDYYVKRYNYRIVHHNWPVISTRRGGFIPVELGVLQPDQQYKYKLDPDQTAKMIKFAVTRPKDRLQNIKNGVDMLNWQADPYLKHYGVRISNELTLSKARQLPPPDIQFSGSKVSPQLAGRWDLRGKKFFKGNPVPLKSWGVCILDASVDAATLQNFLKVFIQTYAGHGGNVVNKAPYIQSFPRLANIAEAVTKVRAGVLQQSGGVEAQIIFFVMGVRDSFMYERVKKSMDCRYGIVSQCMFAGHVIKAQPQYCSNVCMKVNAKLGGTTSRLAGKTAALGPTHCSVPTMFIGADVSHPSPGSPQPSMAAITMSMDIDGCRYAAACQTNGVRVEIVQESTWKDTIVPLMRHWVSTVGKGVGPRHIYYIRDGISEGQYHQVLTEEFEAMKACIRDAFGQGALAGIKWTVIIASKRHQIRFFPKDSDNVAGDRNGNPQCGTVVERDVVHPFQYDFYLNAHSAIQGTARPVHYHVLRDETDVKPDRLMTMLYEHSYQYMRSTTPVSLHPAVYYAHLASLRAHAHEDYASDKGPRGGQKFQEEYNLWVGSGKKESFRGPDGKVVHITAAQREHWLKHMGEVPKLIGLGSMAAALGIPNGDNITRRNIKTTMWFI